MEKVVPYSDHSLYILSNRIIKQLFEIRLTTGGKWGIRAAFDRSLFGINRINQGINTVCDLLGYHKSSRQQNVAYSWVYNT